MNPGVPEQPNKIAQSALDCYNKGAGQVARYVVLRISPMSIVAPLIGATPLFVIGFFFLISRDLETLTARVILGAVLVVLGTVILFGF